MSRTEFTQEQLGYFQDFPLATQQWKVSVGQCDAGTHNSVPAQYTMAYSVLVEHRPASQQHSDGKFTQLEMNFR